MTDVLTRNNIDMRALSLAEPKDFGIVRVIVDEPSGLAQVLGVLSDAQVNAEYMYAFLGGKTADHAYMIFRVQDNAAASAALKAKGIRLVEQEEIAKL